jgi:hypothetical protein
MFAAIVEVDGRELRSSFSQSLGYLTDYAERMPGIVAIDELTPGGPVRVWVRTSPPGDSSNSVEAPSERIPD